MSPRIPVPAPRSSTVSPGVTTSSIAWRNADRRLASARYCRCSSRTSDIRRSRRSGDAVSQASRHHHGARVTEDRSARVRQLLDGSILDEARLHVSLLLRRLERRVLRGLFGHGLSSWVLPCARLWKHGSVPQFRRHDHPDLPQAAEIASAQALVHLADARADDVPIGLQAQPREDPGSALTLERSGEQICEVALRRTPRHGMREEIPCRPTQDELGLRTTPSLLLRQRQSELDETAIVERESALHRPAALESVEHLVLGGAPPALQLASDRALSMCRKRRARESVV